MTRAVLVLVLLSVGCSAPRGGTIRGYVLDGRGHRAPHAHIIASDLPPTDQHPPQLAKRLGETTADSHGDFTLSLAAVTPYTLLIASFDHQAGSAAPSFDHPVRIPLRPTRSRVLP
jgi:hypothetical protein